MTDPMENQALLSQIRAEIEAVHRFISAWFRGEETPSAEAFAAGLANRFAPGLINIQPAGRVLTREALLSSIEAHHGANPDFRIEIGDVTLRHSGHGLLLATYVERQSGARHSSPQNDRISTVLMRSRADDDALEWLHIHETAVPDDPISRIS